MIGTYLLTVGLIFSVALGGIAVDRIYRRFAARNPRLGPFRDTSKCGSCAVGSVCIEASCDDDGGTHQARPVAEQTFTERIKCRQKNRKPTAAPRPILPS